MTIILCDISALEFWRFDRSAKHRRCAYGGALRKNSASFVKPDKKQLESLRANGFSFLSEPIHVLVPDAGLRPKDARIHCHVRPRQLPRDSFMRISEDVFVCRAELGFIQRASGQSLARQVLDGLELCGTYRRPVGGRSTVYQVQPVTSSAELASYAAKAGGIHGAVLARQALRYCMDGSESPMESILVVLFCFPVRLGGYGFPLPVLNFRMDATDLAKNATGKSGFRCDLFWPDAKLVVEYDGREHHGELARRSSDGSRHAALVGMGFEVVRITSENVRNDKEFDAIARSIAKRLNLRMRPTKRDWSAKRDQLRSDILPWPIPLS